MLTLYKHELRLHIKSLLIWTICVGGMCFACILLFSSMEESMASMAENYASMGAFADAFGMSKLSIATLVGFYATEVGTIHGLGGAMFAAIVSTVMLSKEEDGHTSEFLFSLPISRGKAITAKWGAVVTNIFLFNLICVCIYVLGFAVLGEKIPVADFALYHVMQLIMQIEIAGLCFGLSACMKKNKLGLGLGIVLLLYAYDLMARVIPDMSDYKIISPFSYANASDVFSTGKVSVPAIVIGMIVLFGSICAAYVVYRKRDLAA
ncbi:ABC transporter permease subunit [Anaerosporobacter sp.]